MIKEVMGTQKKNAYLTSINSYPIHISINSTGSRSVFFISNIIDEENFKIGKFELLGLGCQNQEDQMTLIGGQRSILYRSCICHMDASDRWGKRIVFSPRKEGKTHNSPQL